LGQVLAIIANDIFEHDLDPKLIQALGEEKRVSVLSEGG
jgi:hypothetical protein